MPEGGLAQWLLSRATTPERADAVLGDCLEQAQLRGQLWFWKSILQTAVSLSLTGECRRSWSLIPALIDSTVWAVLVYFFAGTSWRGGLIMLAGSMLWGLIELRLFPRLDSKKWNWLRVSWTCVAVLILYRLFPPH